MAQLIYSQLPIRVDLLFKQLLFTMSQKFINLVEKTQKKVPVYNQQKPKRFARKTSQSSDRSIDSKRSRASDFQPQHIKYSPQQFEYKNDKVYLDNNNIYQHLAKQTLLIKQMPSCRQKYSRTRTDRMRGQSRQQSSQKVLELHTQLQVRNKQMQVLANECKYLKQSVVDQGAKRKKVQNQNKEILEQLNKSKKQIQKWQIQNKKLTKQKQYLQKQIQFLERINYDQKTRSSQSYREKYLQKEVNKLKETLKKGQNDNQKLLQQQIASLKDQKYIVQSHYRALKVAHQSLQKQFQKQKYQEKQSVLQSDEYVKLRQKYKRFLEQYKRLRIQYCELQAQLNLSKSQIIQKDQYQQLSINLSQSSSEKSESKFKGLHSINAKVQNLKQNNLNYKFQNTKKTEGDFNVPSSNLHIKDKNIANVKQTGKHAKGVILGLQKRKFEI